ncbi:hypothetical protein [Klebsiella pneumoniae]|uniref:hypothetical protein n=1 Tax=Klebsiella pneumoniae TaxID=573 RepID=UPI0034D2865B
MTITLQAVNELIASLESAGELSIREQKFLNLAKEFRICSASLDAAIKTGNMLADQNSQLAAENAALKSAVDHTIEWIESTNGDPCDVVILKGIRTPATDRIVAGFKADGAEEFAAHLVSMECHLEAKWAKSFVLEVLNVKGR